MATGKGNPILQVYQIVLDVSEVGLQHHAGGTNSQERLWSRLAKLCYRERNRLTFDM